MEMLCVGFLIGALVAIVFFGSGVCFGGCNCRDSEGQHDGLDDMRTHIPWRDRDRSGDNRHAVPDSEEIDNVLHVLRIGSSGRERRVIDYLIEKERRNGSDT